MLIPVQSTLIDAEARLTAQLRLARILIAVERHYLATGDLPTALEHTSAAFLEETQIDPFDDQAIRYRTTEQGYIVYSIGLNEVDDGGIEGADTYSGDIVMEARH